MDSRLRNALVGFAATAVATGAIVLLWLWATSASDNDLASASSILGLLLVSIAAAVVVVLMWVIPIFVLLYVTDACGRSRTVALWGVASYAGLVIGLLVLIALPRRPVEERE